MKEGKADIGKLLCRARRNTALFPGLPAFLSGEEGSRKARKMRKKLQTRFSRRQVMERQDFELYYYEDSEPIQLPAHTHKHMEIYIFVEGNIAMEIAGEQTELQYGDVVFIPPGVYHRAVITGTKKTYRRFVLWMDMGLYRTLLDESADYGYMARTVGSDRGLVWHNNSVSLQMIYARVFRLLEERDGRQFGRETACEICLRDLLLELNRSVYMHLKDKRCLPAMERGQTVRGEGAGLCEAVRLYVEEHLTEDIRLDRLADELYVSKYYLSHTFKERMGIPIHQYIIRKRLELARERLRQGVPATNLWLELGFSDYSGFFRSFKKEYGMSPTRYRREFSTGHVGVVK